MGCIKQQAQSSSISRPSQTLHNMHCLHNGSSHASLTWIHIFPFLPIPASKCNGLPIKLASALFVAIQCHGSTDGMVWSSMTLTDDQQEKYWHTSTALISHRTTFISATAIMLHNLQQKIKCYIMHNYVRLQQQHSSSANQVCRQFQFFIDIPTTTFLFSNSFHLITRHCKPTI